MNLDAPSEVAAAGTELARLNIQPRHFVSFLVVRLAILGYVSSSGGFCAFSGILATTDETGVQLRWLS